MLSLAQSPVRTLIACFSRRAKSLRPSHRTRNAPRQGYLTLYQLKTRVQTVGYQNTETLLYTIKAPFFPQEEKASQLFFLIIDFIMVKWIDTCQVSQEVFSPKWPPCPPSAGAAFPVSHAGSPSLHMPFFPARVAGAAAVTYGDPEVGSVAAREQRLISQLFHGYPRPRLKKSGFKKSHIFFLTISYASGHVTLSSIYAGDKRNSSLFR